MTEDQLEQEALSWLVEVGYTHLSGYDIAPDDSAPERDHFRQPQHRPVLTQRFLHRSGC